MRCDWKLAETQFGIVLEYFRCDAVRIWLRYSLELSYNTFDNMRLELSYDIIWNCLGIFSIICDWNLAKTQIGIVLEYFRLDAMGIGLRHNLELS